jgi:hypothetical protein
MAALTAKSAMAARTARAAAGAANTHKAVSAAGKVRELAAAAGRLQGGRAVAAAALQSCEDAELTRRLLLSYVTLTH